MQHCTWGQELVLLGALLSFQLASCNSPENIALLAAFFTILGDDLALIAAARDICPAPCPPAKKGTDTETCIGANG